MAWRFLSVAFFVFLQLFSLSARSETLWRSSAGNDTVIAAEVEDLYLRLYKDNQLRTIEYKDAVGRPVQDILREQGKVVGDMFPIGISSVLCNLNPTVCKLNNSNEPSWTNKAGDVLNIPVIDFKEFTVFGTKIKPSGVSPDLLISNSHADCSAYGASCKEVTNALNGHNPEVLTTAGEGNIILPERGFQTNLDASVSDLSIGKIDQKTINQIGKTSGFSLPSFEYRIAPAGKANIQGAYGNEPLFVKQDELFRLLNFDFAELADVSNVEQRFKDPIQIEVLDTWFDSSHCDLPNVTVLFEEPPPALARTKLSCGAQLAEGATNAILDHATHVIGLIGAEVNGQAAAGLNPFAKILYRQVALESFTDVLARDQLSMEMVRDYFNVSTRPAIFNLSWGYRNEFGRSDMLKNTIKEALQGALFVVAAGNNNLVFEDGECSAMPACLADLPNVVTVIGLNRDFANPGVWKTGDEGSNVSPRFHLGAIAADVISTSGGNGYTMMSGTSQAAPQVTAAAAYIYSAYGALFNDQGPLRPSRVKSRLIYTTDLFPELLRDAVGGRLNFRRALDIAFDNVVYRTPDGDKNLRGRLEEIGTPDGSILCRRKLTEELIPIKLTELRRMHFDEARGLYVIFYDAPGEAEQVVRRISDCELRTRSQLARFITSQAEATFRLDNIVDYVSKL